MDMFIITPDLFMEAWDAEDARQRARQLFDWLQDCPLMDIAFTMPEGCVEKFDESADEEGVF